MPSTFTDHFAPIPVAPLEPTLPTTRSTRSPSTTRQASSNPLASISSSHPPLLANLAAATHRPRPSSDIELTAFSPGSPRIQDSQLDSSYDPDPDNRTHHRRSTSRAFASEEDLLDPMSRRKGGSGGTKRNTRSNKTERESLDDVMNSSSSVEYRKKGTRRGGVEGEDDLLREQLMHGERFSLDNNPEGELKDGRGDSGKSFFDLSKQDQRNFILLVLLYFLQGVPMGLAMGSVPFLLKHKLSYGEIGVFSLASYPYSMKLLWSPIVDAIWSRRFGRRKSWIVPIQTISGLMLVWMGGRAENMMEHAASTLYMFTFVFFMLVMLCATQDIAVDGWAITLLSQDNLSYASTAQTVGLTAGQFLSFTVFLAFNSPDFANKWFRAVPSEQGLMTLGGYLTFWGWTYLIVTVGLALLKKEDKTREKESLVAVYKTMWAVLSLKHVQTFIIVHLIAKIGFQANEAATNLKLLDKGFSQEDMALTVLIDFPFEIALGYYAGQWCSYFQPMRLWSWAFMGRLVAAVIAQITVYIFPSNGQVGTWYLCVVIAEHIFSTFTSTVMFVAVSAFHAQIADPTIGGTYMTLLATVSNLGGTFPRIFVLKLIDVFTKATCLPNPSLTSSAKPITFEPFSCALESDKQRCLSSEFNGVCNVEQDGYYIMNMICVVFGTVSFYMYIWPKVRYLQSLPLRAWREREGGGRL
ncbi:hypothetical protein BJ508DRAFT_410767 [Ascobolus immersus RN42]|uniref:MFS general substrate transporter n=1 Tax=Ascobolus immersus RN42 TaxID=1160509 RepID=A0A3N4ISP0_ASCIM|nr:hypothetical protein BJ508DRAFT_410767 [Ascobolus immersus RN42]